MSIATISNKNILHKRIFFPELGTEVLLIAIPKNHVLTDIYQSSKQLVFTSIENPHQFLCEHSIFLITESSIFDTKILLTLYKVLMYKDTCFINNLLGHPCIADIYKCYLVNVHIAQKWYCQGLLVSNRSLISKAIINNKLIQNLLSSLCHSLWIFYRNCITYIYLMLKSNSNLNIDNLNRNYCICDVEDTDYNFEIHKFKIFSVIQAKHIENYYNFQSHLFQSLTHRKKNWCYETSKELDQTATNDNLLYMTNISSNLDSWKALWNYYQITFNTGPFTGRNFHKQATLTSKEPRKETADWIKCTVSKIRRKLKGTLYVSAVSNDTNSVSQKDVNNSVPTLNNDISKYNNMEVHKDLKKYWVKRYRLFSKFDDGIKLDYESWFSVTPEKIAIHIASKCKSDIIIDAFCGAGGNSIQFANSCQQVISIDIDLQKLLMARHNAKIYGVDNKIDFILGNFFCLAGDLIGDVVFLSPPWGGPKYVKKNVFDLKNIMQPYGGDKLLKTAQKISRNIAYYLPKNIDTSQLLCAAGSETRVEVEKNFLNDQVVAVTAYYGDLVDKTV